VRRGVSQYDSPLDGRWVALPTSRGSVVYGWEPPMLSIPKRWLDAVVYLYPDEDAARAGKRLGGTGFFVSVPSQGEYLAGRRHVYVVTNSHVSHEGGCTAVRMNHTDGGFDVVTVSETRWFRHPAGDDVAVAPFFIAPAHRHATVPRSMFMTAELEEHYGVTSGDDCFFMGRFIGLDGETQNQPSVRFGTVSLMDAEPILQAERGFYQASYLVEARSLSGYSGSPVFVIPGPYVKTDQEDGIVYAHTLLKAPIFLMGIDWGHQHWAEPVRDGAGRVTGDHVRTNSGMMMVAPAAKIAQALDQEVLLEMRREVDKTANDLLAEQSKVDASASLDVASGDDRRVSLAPLEFEEALGALLAVPPNDES
jgi:hypothetical protein